MTTTPGASDKQRFDVLRKAGTLFGLDLSGLFEDGEGEATGFGGLVPSFEVTSYLKGRSPGTLTYETPKTPAQETTFSLTAPTEVLPAPSAAPQPAPLGGGQNITINMPRFEPEQEAKKTYNVDVSKGQSSTLFGHQDYFRNLEAGVPKEYLKDWITQNTGLLGEGNKPGKGGLYDEMMAGDVKFPGFLPSSSAGTVSEGGTTQPTQTTAATDTTSAPGTTEPTVRLAGQKVKALAGAGPVLSKKEAESIAKSQGRTVAQVMASAQNKNVAMGAGLVNALTSGKISATPFSAAAKTLAPMQGLRLNQGSAYAGFSTTTTPATASIKGQGGQPATTTTTPIVVPRSVLAGSTQGGGAGGQGGGSQGGGGGGSQGGGGGGQGGGGGGQGGGGKGGGGGQGGGQGGGGQGGGGQGGGGKGGGGGQGGGGKGGGGKNK